MGLSISGKKYHHFTESTNTLTADMQKIRFPEACTISALTDEAGESLMADFFGDGTVTIAEGTEIEREVGKWFGSITGSAGSVEYWLK